MRHGRIKKTLSDVVFETVITAFLLFVLIIVLYPLVYIVSCSFSDSIAVISGRVWLFPVEPTILADG